IIEGNYWKGDLRVALSGKKLAGTWQLHRDDDRKWTLEKTADEKGRQRRRRHVHDTSALTGRTMERIAVDNDRQWQSNRSGPAQLRSAPAKRYGTRHDPVDLAKLPAATPAFMEPMRPVLVTTLPEGAEWSYEPKLDGYRALALKTGSSVQ